MRHKSAGFFQIILWEADRKVDKEIGKKICPEYITNLVNQLRHAKLTDDNKVLVIYLLGELRPTDTNSIESPIENIDLRTTKIGSPDRMPCWGCYPAQDALIKIGMPSTIPVLSGLSEADRGKAVVNPILNHLPSETNELRQHLMCEALVRIEGKKGPHFDEAEGKKIVQDQIKDKLVSKQDPAKHANLEAALKEVTK